MSNPDSHKRRIAVIYPAKAGLGGLGHCSAWTIGALASRSLDVTAWGPGFRAPWPFAGGVAPVQWLDSPAFVADWQLKWTWLRWQAGSITYRTDQALGRWAASHLPGLRPDLCYSFTQVGLETLRWAKAEGVFTALENPNGHILNFREVCERESRQLCGKRFLGHPSQEMVDRVLAEYDLAGVIRVYSEWAKQSMTRAGIPAEKIQVVPPGVNLERFRPPSAKPLRQGSLRICFVGSLDLRKGFAYLLRAIRLMGASHIELEIVGATGDRDSARLFARERQGLQVLCAPGDPLRAYQEADLFVMPTLEDGFGLVVGEAMACGLPVIVTDQCGAKDCVTENVDGWVVPSAQVDALASALENAVRRRQDLPEMGRSARSKATQYFGPAAASRLAELFFPGSAVEQVHDEAFAGSNTGTMGAWPPAAATKERGCEF